MCRFEPEQAPDRTTTSDPSYGETHSAGDPIVRSCDTR